MFEDEVNELIDGEIANWGLDGANIPKDGAYVRFPHNTPATFDDIRTLDDVYGVVEIQPGWEFSRTQPKGSVIVVLDNVVGV